ncbi:uncharacterized protein LOC110991187 [Acanthaster planci]|uniref:Uncharacterized protein LOC110991187 n=1 Tax=Acanthaster planci TaxID=133434 RepID=A0A8B8A5C4_ACAPL|nr:uncharacterized protein LOC110991187 [Acanthaster planci]
MTSSDSLDDPRPKVAKQALDNIESEHKMNQVDAKIQGELTPQEIRDLKDVFDTFDKEHRGRRSWEDSPSSVSLPRSIFAREKGNLTFDDIKNASQAVGLKFRDSTIRDLMDEADTNGDDITRKEEFFQNL